MKTLELLPPSETMYRALVKRDPSFEGIFYVGVRTTGIFCRPTCTAKKPARENVDFFARANEALESGYRPCLRCHPLDPNARPPKLIERLRAEGERARGGRLTDKELAAMSIDPSTARRQFKRHYRTTFQAYYWDCHYAKGNAAVESARFKTAVASSQPAGFAMRLPGFAGNRRPRQKNKGAY